MLKPQLLFSLPFPGCWEFCPVLSSARPLGIQHLWTRQRINGKIVYTNLRKEILDMSITVLCPDWNKVRGQGNQHLNNTRIAFTQCTWTACLHLCVCNTCTILHTHIWKEEKITHKATEPRNQLLRKEKKKQVIPQAPQHEPIGFLDIFTKSTIREKWMDFFLFYHFFYFMCTGVDLHASLCAMCVEGSRRPE